MPLKFHGLPLSLPLGIGWAFLWITASVVYRRAKGKPIFTSAPPHSLFAEAWRSGHSLRNPLTRFGGARNALRVVISQGSLQVTPHFPFNLLFIPEIYGLEFVAPAAAIQSVQLLPGVFSSNRVRVTFRNNDGVEEQFDLFLKDPRAFEAAIAAIRQTT